MNDAERHAALAAACESVGVHSYSKKHHPKCPCEKHPNALFPCECIPFDDKMLPARELRERLEGWLNANGYRAILYLDEELRQVSWREHDWKTVIAVASNTDEETARGECVLATVEKARKP